MRFTPPARPHALLIAAAALVACRTSRATAPAAPPERPAPAAASAPAPSGPPLPLTPAIRHARLPSGLTYYVRRNPKPEKRAAVWLVVNAGSVLEDDDQRGLAHLLEHMAFDGTRHHAKHEILEYLQRLGMRFGPDINAFTTFDETVYTLEMPTDDPAVLERGIDILHEWAEGIAIEQDELARERRVVLEERRLGRGAQGRLLDALIPAALPGSRYGARLPIGLAETVERATPELIRRFYRDWYRPDLMAVVAVGDFDPAAVEKIIAARFADLQRPARPRPRPDHAVPPHSETVAIALSDPELPATVVAVAAKRAHRATASERDFRQALVEWMFAEMLNQRFDELRQAADAPFLRAGVGRQSPVRAIDVWFQFALVKGGQVRESLEALTAEVARVARLGFTDGEIERARKNLVQSYRQRAHEADDIPSPVYAAEIQRHFLTGDAIPGLAAELALVERLAPGITGEDIRAVAAEVASEQNRVIVAAGHTSTALPARTELLAAAAAGRARAAAAYADDAGAGDLLDRPPAPGTIVRERAIREIGATEWRLSNGLTVVLKPTDFQSDTVLVGIRTPGGTSQASDADYFSARAAVEIAAAGGFGERSAVQLTRRLAGTGVSAGLAIGEVEAFARGTAPRGQLELLLQVMHLQLTRPRRDEKAFAAWKTEAIDLLRNELASPELAFEDRFASEAGGGHLRRRRPTAADYEKVDLDRALTFYRERFASFRGSTAFLVGAFDVDAVKPWVLAYLGGLPGKGPAPRWRDAHVTRPRGAVRFRLAQGLEPKAAVKLRFHGAARWSREAEHELDSLAEALEIRLREELREEMGGVYQVSVVAGLRRDPAPEYELTIEFGCAPENLDRLVARTRAEIEAFRRSGPPAAAVDKVALAQRRELETSLKDNDYWFAALARSYRLGTDPRLILEQGRLIDRLGPKTLEAAARRVFGANEVLGELVPQ